MIPGSGAPPTAPWALSAEMAAEQHTRLIREGRAHELVQPRERRGAVFVEVPHAGLAIPDELRDVLHTQPSSLYRDSDIFVDELYADAPSAGASLLVARASRYVVDLNRGADDVDRSTVPDHPDPRGLQPRGVVWRMATDGRALMERPLRYAAFRERIALYHAPYHRLLEGELRRLREVYGYAIGIAAHSMPSVGRRLRSTRPERRPDVIPGSQGRRSADPRVIDLVDAHFRAAGLSVRHDDPYRGGYSTQHYGRPHADWHLVQIELNRALYVDEVSSRPKVNEFTELRSVLTALIRKLGDLDLGS